MKKNITLSILLLVVLCSINAQESSCENKEILICNIDANSFHIKELEKCNNIRLNNSDFEVSSFIVSTAFKGSLLETKVKGNHFDEEALKTLKKSTSKVLYIEVVTLSNGEMVGCKKINLLRD